MPGGIHVAAPSVTAIHSLGRGQYIHLKTAGLGHFLQNKSF